MGHVTVGRRVGDTVCRQCAIFSTFVEKGASQLMLFAKAEGLIYLSAELQNAVFKKKQNTDFPETWQKDETWAKEQTQLIFGYVEKLIPGGN